MALGEVRRGLGQVVDGVYEGPIEIEDKEHGDSGVYERLHDRSRGVFRPPYAGDETVSGYSPV